MQGQWNSVRELHCWVTGPNVNGKTSIYIYIYSGVEFQADRDLDSLTSLLLEI